MKKLILFLMAIGLFTAMQTLAQGPRVKTANGIAEGTIDSTGIHSFKGIPFAQPPVGDLRWKEPQPVKNWDGILKAQLDYRHMPCNFVEIMPRLDEHLKRGKLKAAK